MAKSQKVSKIEKIKESQEEGARRAILEDLFYDFHRSRKQVYIMNFVRGMMFGLGSVIGGTLIVAIALWLLNLFGDVPGGIGDFVRSIVDTVNERDV